MAKKKQSAPAPQVSSLPIKQDQSPLVIDLPDGQKLVVGHLSNGSVIEVATWRGTGRPDSRTSRLMLGMSSHADAAAAEAQTSENAAAKKSPIAPVIAKIQNFLVKVKSAKKVKPAKVESTEPATPFVQTVTPRVSNESADVQDWLDSIIAKSEAKAKKSSQPAKQVRKAAPKSTRKRAR